MKTLNTKNSFGVYFWSVLLAMGILMSIVPGTAAAKSVYLAAEHHTGRFDAWQINPDGTVTYQATYNLNYATDPAGIAIDTMTGTDPVTGKPRDPLMFVSTEGIGGIEVINPVTLQFHGVASGPVNMGGVDVDDIDNIIFAIQRGSSAWGGSGTSNLYIYTYNDDGSGITQQAIITVPNHGAGFSLALDDLRDVLWIGDTPNMMVKAYKPDNPAWTVIHEDPNLSFSVSHQPIDVAVDRTRNLVYTVGGWYGSRLLTKYDVENKQETTVNLGHRGCGLAVEETKGYVYITGGPYEAQNLSVWDCSTTPFNEIQDVGDIGSPAGIAIGNVSYNLLNLAKNDIIVAEGVYIGSYYTFEITCDNTRNPELNATNVTILDTMPPELDYISSTIGSVPQDPNVYDPCTHTVLWDIGTIPGGGTAPLIELEVQVNQNAIPGSTVMNHATIDYTIAGVEESTTVEDDGGDPTGEPGTPVLVCKLVEIDIKPGGYPNAINLGSQGLIPVAILSSEEFDATTVNPDTVELAGANVAVRGKGNKYMAHKEDVNGDGLVDLVIQAGTANLDPDSFQDGSAILTGETYDGMCITGEDEITIVPTE